MIGQRFTRLTVLSLDHLDGRHRKHYLCRCDCGAEKTVQATLLRSGNTKSCGCLSAENKRTLTKLPDHGGVITFMMLQYRRHARDAGRTFELTRAQFIALVTAPCHYCGSENSNTIYTKNCREGFPSNGIDRTDNALGYVISNVVPCCRRCNTAKGARWTYETAVRRLARV